MQFGQQFLLLRVHHYKKKMTQMQFSLLRLLNLQSHSTDNTFKGKGNKKRKVSSRNSLKSFRFLRFIIISFIMQEHQKEHKEPIHEQKVDKKDKNELKPFKILPTIIELYNYVPSPVSLGPMHTSYLSGAASFAGTFEGPYNEDTMKMMGLSDRIIIDSFNSGVLKGHGIHTVYYKDPAGSMGNWFQTYGIKPLKAKWKPTKIQIFDIKIESTFIAQKFYTNHLDRQVLYKAEIVYQTAQTTTSQWNKEFSQSLGVSANAGIEIKFISAGVTIETVQTTTVGMSQSFSKEVTLGTTSGVEVPVKAFQSIRVELSASLGTAKARVTYDIQLDGHILALGSTPTSATTVGVPASYFEFKKTTTIDQIVNISSYGKDYIQTFPWDPNAPR